LELEHREISVGDMISRIRDDTRKELDALVRTVRSLSETVEVLRRDNILLHQKCDGLGGGLEGKGSPSGHSSEQLVLQVKSQADEITALKQQLDQQHRSQMSSLQSLKDELDLLQNPESSKREAGHSPVQSGELLMMKNQVSDLTTDFRKMATKLSYVESTDAKVTEIMKNLLPDVKKGSAPIFLKVQSTVAIANGAWFNWNTALQVPQTHFQHNGAESITIKQGGWYQVMVRYVAQGSGNGVGAGNIDLYQNNNVVARAYHGQNDGHQQSRTLLELINMSNNDIVKVIYRSNSNSLADQLATVLTIVFLGS